MPIRHWNYKNKQGKYSPSPTAHGKGTLNLSMGIKEKPLRGSDSKLRSLAGVRIHHKEVEEKSKKLNATEREKGPSKGAEGGKSILRK